MTLKSLIRTGLFIVLSTISLNLKAQDYKNIYYNPVEVSESEIADMGTPQINATAYKIFQIDIEVLKPQLIGIGQTLSPNSGFTAKISFPHPDGSLHEYEALANTTLSPGLQAKFPQIKTYDAADKEGRKVKWDITHKGLHVMILQPNESTIFIDPIINGNDQYYIVYHKKDFTTDKLMSCDFVGSEIDLKAPEDATSGEVRTFGTCELRTYRLALAATGEYTVYHGGTVGDAQAAQAVTMNRVNGVFERDMAITMTIIPNNDLIIYTNGGSDPYSNGNPGSMINQNQSNCDAEIGNGNYDIGHVFGTNSGGLAGLGVVCNNSNKARGVTGSANPIGDPFDIDYVAHEMGHQFGANHTQNNPCNSVSATRMEPGSASTIMGYAGICAPNVQSNSDDHFHGISLEEIGDEILSGGHTCEMITALTNNPPTITATNGNVTIPANTPFALTATVTDPDGDPILYCWEQMDNEASTQPPQPTNNDGPNFRSNSPDLSPTRYFPNLTDLTAGVSPTWEVIPSVSRTMNFRVTVRDQSLNTPGCNDHADVTVTFDDGSGPFVVTYPSATGIVWTTSTSETVTWSVAGTDGAPVNCNSVDILLSTDGGLTYPTTLASGVPNDGSETITVPGTPTTTARVMVINSNGTFFDISDNDFEIAGPACVDPDVPTLGGTTTICDGQNTTLSVTGGNLNDATDWQWYDSTCGGTNVGSGTSISVSPNTTTSYFVRGEGGCVTAGSCTFIEVTVNPVYNLNENASICQGETHTYPDGSTGTVSEMHTSSLTTVNGCDSIIVTDLTVMPTYSSNESADICSGDTYTFPDGTTGSTAQTYVSTLTSVDGCDSTITTDLTVNTVDNSVTQTGATLEANQVGATYQWVDCDNSYAPVAGETSQSFAPVSGNYAVVITINGCEDTSACYLIDPTGINELESYQVSIFPNPAHSNVKISWQGEVSAVEITDARGRLIYSIQPNTEDLDIDIQEFSKGVYFVHLFTEDGRIVKELVKE